MADGIPYPQAPRLEQQNPFQTISNLQALDQRQQAMQQQEIAMRSKMAVGRHMQAHIDPQTGQLDTHAFMSSLAADPEAGPSFMEVHHMMKENGEIDERTMGMQLENQQKRLSAISNMMAPLQAKVARGEPIDESALSGAIAMGISNGAFKNRQDGLNTLLAWTGQAKGSPGAAKNIVLGMSQYTDNARAALEKNMMDMQSAYKMVPQVSPMGTPFEQPARAVPGALPPGAMSPQPIARQQSPMGEEGIAEGGASAPRTMPSARQEESPSAPPATLPSDIPAGAIRKGGAPQYKEMADYMADTEGTKHWLRKDITEAENEANKAVAIQTKLAQQVDLLRQFEQGPLMDARVWTAERLRGLGFPEGTVKRLLGAKPGSKDALAAAQAARKDIFELAGQELKSSLPGVSRVTNFDIQSALKAIPTLETTKGAANIIFGHYQNAINIAKERANAVGRYAQWSLDRPEDRRAFNRSHLEKSFRDMLKHKKLLRDEELDASKPLGAQ